MPTPRHGKTEQNSAVSTRTSLAATIHFTTVTTTQKGKYLPFCNTALHLILFENVLNVNKISSIITNTLYIV
jgi:hypothetical protein